MYKGKTFLAIIPARSGSKGLKDKNIKELAGKPMIAYTIEAAINSKIFDRIIVSTDSEEYAEIAKKYGADVPFIRPDDLAQDTTSSTEVNVHVLQALKDMNEEYDYFMLLQPTSPLRGMNDIRQSVELLIEKKALSIISMCECLHPIEWTTLLDEHKSLAGFLKDAPYRRQDSKRYQINGAIYLCNTETYMKTKNYYGEQSYAFIMDKYSSLDVDDIYDFKYVEMLMKEQNR